MSFEIPALVIEYGSPEARAVEYVMREDHVSAAEAVVSILMKCSAHRAKAPIGCGFEREP